MSMALRYAVRSDRGLVRGDNQDSVYAGPRLLAVADGIGGQVGGATASRVVIATFAPLDEDTAPREMLGVLRETTQVANAHLRTVIEEQPDLNGMGTTLTAMLFDGSRLGVVHVGDSRAYLLRGRKFSQITKDQTFVQALVDEGRITPEEASNHPQRSVILRALAGADVDPDLSMREAKLGERYLLCSDGLSDYVSGQSIADALAIEDPHAAADRLIELALRAGGRDNITCIVADVVAADEGDEVPVVGGAASDEAEPDEVHPTSAAARAAIAVPPGQGETEDDEPPEAPRQRWFQRRLVYAMSALVVLAGGLIGFYEWSQAQYFVGETDGQVAIFKGVNVSIGGAHLYHSVHTSDLVLADLVATARDQIKSGVSADNRSDADRILANLGRNELLPLCTASTPAPTSTPIKPSPSKPTPTVKHTAHRGTPPTKPATKRSPKKPTSKATPTKHAAKATGHHTVTPSRSGDNAAGNTANPPSSAAVTLAAPPTSVPGKDCR